jgi:NAD-dependent SIR2 family protein deacetylase
LLEHPHLFWGFYGSRLKMYREKNPHNGFQVIKNLAKSMSEKTKLNDNLFVLTSNVDGHFTKAEYPSDRVF